MSELNHESTDLSYDPIRRVPYQCENCLEQSTLFTTSLNPGKQICNACGETSHPTKKPSKIILKPCPFCGGPPVPILSEDSGSSVSLNLDDTFVKPSEGLYVKALVFCHECGCTGPEVRNLVYSINDAKRLRDGAVRRWQERGGNGRVMNSMECYNIEQATYTFAEIQEDDLDTEDE